MKREDAIEIEAAFVRRDSEILGTDDRVSEAIVQALAAVNVDRLIAFGLLKLDEPKSQRDRLVEILGRRDWMASDVDEFRECICEAGLHIIEK